MGLVSVSRTYIVEIAVIRIGFKLNVYVSLNGLDIKVFQHFKLCLNL